MNISTRGRYGLRAMLALAQRLQTFASPMAQPARWVRVDTMADVDAVAATIAAEVMRRYPYLAERGP